MRTQASTFSRLLVRFKKEIRLIIITIVTIVFYAKLAMGANIANPNLPMCTNLENSIGNQGWIGAKEGNALILELDALEITDFEILLDDSPYSGIIRTHEEKTIQVFNLSELQTGSFYVHEFWINDKKIKGKFESLIEWVEYLNKKTFVNWALDMSRGLVICDKERVLFNDFIVSRSIDDGKMKSFAAVSASITKNVMIEIPAGVRRVTVHNFITGCSETKELLIEKEMALKGKKRQ